MQLPIKRLLLFVVLIIITGGVFWSIYRFSGGFQKKREIILPEPRVVKPLVVSEYQEFDNGKIRFVVPTGWEVRIATSTLYELYRKEDTGETTIMSIDLSSGRAYGETLQGIKSSIEGLRTESVMVTDVLGQELIGTVTTGDASRYVSYSILDNDGEAIVMTYSEDPQNEDHLRDYRLIRQSIQLADRVLPESGKFPKTPNGNEIVPPYLQNGIAAKHQFLNGKHYVNGTVILPTTCYEFKVAPTVQSLDFVIIGFSAVQPLDVLCVEQTGEYDFAFSFDANETADIRAEFNRLPVLLHFE